MWLLMLHAAWSATPSLGESLGAVTSSPQVEAGNYRLELEYRWRGYVTRERVHSTHTHGELELELTPEGTFTGTVTAETTQRTSVSRFGTDDGQPEETEETELHTQYFVGTWRQEGSRARISLTGTTTNQGAPMNPLNDPVILYCVTLTGGKLPTTTLACQTTGRQPAALKLDLHVPAGPPPFPAPPSGTEPRATGGWVLLGADAGLSVSWSAQDSRDQMVTFSSP
jgi:hypothetical protein